MKIVSCVLAFLGLVSAPAAFGAANELAPIDIAANNQTIPVRVTSTAADLQALAQTAFDVHGRYRRVDSGHRYDISFTSVGPSRVRVEVKRSSGGTVVVSREVEGSASTPAQARRNALLVAADVAVEHTNELGLKGFFSSKLVLIGDRTGKSEVYTTGDLFFGGVAQITFDRNHSLMPRWSPDGARIIYTGYFRQSVPNIYLINLATNPIRRTDIATYEGTNQGGRFSPDGSRIAMALSGTGVSQIYTANADGSRAKQITFDTGTDKSSPVFSPDGSRILYSAAQGSSVQLMVVPAAGGTPQRLSTGFSYNTEPDWSRASPGKIAFSVRVGGRFQIAVYDMATGKGRQVTTAGSDLVQPCWLPDGRHIVCTMQTRTGDQIYVIDTESTSAKRISLLDFGSARQANVWSR